MSASIEGKQYLIFRICGKSFAVSIKDVERIVSIGKVYKIPLARPHFDGLAKVDERAVPIFNVAHALGLNSSGSGDDTIVAIEKLRSQDVGLLVCEVVTVARIAPGDILDCESPFAGVSQKVMWNGNEVNILSAEELVYNDADEC